MPDFNDPRVLAFYAEMYEKEKLLRLNWHVKYNDEIREAAKCRSDHRTSLNMVDKISKTKIKTDNSLGLSKRTSVPIKQSKCKDSFKPLKKVESSVLKLLYSSDNEGRKKFLKETYKKPPRDRHPFPECSSWEYGWYLNDAAPDLIERRGRVAIMNATFFQRSGLSPDPEHYKEPTTF